MRPGRSRAPGLAAAVDAPGGGYFVVAIQFLSKRPGSFAEAARYDYYHEVYVRDRDRRIRLYADLHGSEMAELTARFRPSCPEI